MTAGSVRPLVTKEIRALLPAWIASVVAIGAAVASGPRNHELALVAYGFGSVALGAQSIGHEYTNRTLSLLLSQPASRRRLLFLKLAVLAPMLLALTAVAGLLLLRPGEGLWVFASIANGLFVAPLLTMVCRTPLAAVVFTGAAPFWMLALEHFVGAGVVWGGTLGLSAAAAVASWRMFMRLEAIDGPGHDVRLPRLFRRETTAVLDAHAGARTRHPVWLLVKKELHLQQITFAVTGLWIVIWLAIGVSTRLVPAFAEFPLARLRVAVSIMYGGLLALLIGSLASAEERQMGTLEWQMLLPMAAWRQWAVKAATVLGLAGVLSFAIPVALAAGELGVNARHAGVIAFLATGSLFVSSLCRSGLRALMISGLVMVVLAVLAQFFYTAFGQPLALPAVAAAVAFTLWFGFENHRRAA